MAGRLGLAHQTPPLIARQASFSKLVRDSLLNRLDTIDMADTGANGFDWYRRLAWTGAATFPGQSLWGTLPTNSPGNFSIVNGMLNITGGSTSNYAMSSACQNNSDPRGYSGHMYSGGFYAEADMSWNEGGGVTDGGAAFWSLPKSFYLGTFGALFTEIDFMEAGDLGGSGLATPTHSGMVHWHSSDGHHDGGPMAQNSGNTGDGTMHNWAFLWKTAAQNGGTASFSFYQDGVLQSSFTPPSDVATDAFSLNFNGGFGTIIQRVRVWQRFDAVGD